MGTVRDGSAATLAVAVPAWQAAARASAALHRDDAAGPVEPGVEAPLGEVLGYGVAGPDDPHGAEVRHPLQRRRGPTDQRAEGGEPAGAGAGGGGARGRGGRGRGRAGGERRQQEERAARQPQ